MRGAPAVHRFDAQRWLIDNIIRANGIDWDQPRSLYIHAPCGIEANADFAGIRERVKKMADIGPAFAAVARRREAKANAAAPPTARSPRATISSWPRCIGARRNGPMTRTTRPTSPTTTRSASATPNTPRWPITMSKRCGCRFRTRRSRPGCICRRTIPAASLPVVIAVPGMDSYKEIQVALYGDRFLNRGMAVLAIDGPGQYEAPMIGLNFSMENWVATGPAIVDWIAARPELDATRIGVSGTSFGTLFGTVLAAHEPRIKACAVMSVCHEPGCHTIFEEASPTFKKRFMYMSGITDEAEFDKFRQDHHLGRPRREDQRAVPLRRRRSR